MPVDYSKVLVKRVVDGDTLVLSNGKKARLIGVDTPELHESDKLFRDSANSGVSPKDISYLGRQSMMFTKRLCEKRYLRLEFDSEMYDKYGRILAYAYLPDKKMLNEEILLNGYGIAFTKYKFNAGYKIRFIRAQDVARKYNRGLWAKKPGLRELDRANNIKAVLGFFMFIPEFVHFGER